MLTARLGYRLYTVVPELLQLLDNTTNWYIRFNRRRLKGSDGREATEHALNTLFDVLYTLCRGLAPFIPFLTDHIYKRLREYIPMELRGVDDRSVHFQAYPTVRDELFNDDVERTVGRMQKVINLARPNRLASLKTRLKSLVVIHKDQQYLDDIASLRPYIKEELNVEDVVLSSDEAGYNIHYSVDVDWPVLGRKLRKNMKRVKAALSAVTSDQVKQYIDDGFIDVDGIRLETGDLVVKYSLAENAASEHLKLNSDNDVMIIIDNEVYPELAAVGLAREIISRVQKLRKKAGLQTTDDVEMEYMVVADPKNVGVEAAIESEEEAFRLALRRPLVAENTTDMARLIIEQEEEVQQALLRLRLFKPVEEKR